LFGVMPACRDKQFSEPFTRQIIERHVYSFTFGLLTP
jgi:hypothetical protein